MKSNLWLQIVSVLVGIVIATGQILGAPKKAASQNVSFVRDVAPILVERCLACHGPEKAKGGYELHTFERLNKPGDGKSLPVVAGKPDESEIFRRIIAADADERMPQKDEALSPAQVALIESWIREGAKFDGPDLKAAIKSLIPELPDPRAPAIYPRPVPIRAIAFSPDGKELAVGGYHEITFWDSVSGRLLARCGDLPEQAQAIAYAPKRSLIAVAGGTPGKTGRIVLLDSRQHSVVKSLDKIGDMMFAACFSPDGSLLAAGGADNAIRVFEIPSGNRVLLIEQHADWILGLAFTPDGTHIISASRDKSSRVFDAKTGAMTTAYLGHEEPVYAVAAGEDGKLAFSTGRDKKIHAWKIADGTKVGQVGELDVEVFKLITQGTSLFAGGAGGQVREFSVVAREGIRKFAGSTDWVYSLAIHKETRRLAAGSFNGEVRVWNLDDGHLLATFIAAPGYISPLPKQ